LKETLALLRSVLAFPNDNIADSLAHATRGLCAHLGITTEVISSRELGVGHGLKGEDRVLEICRHLGTSTYINAPGGTDLYDAAHFHALGIALRFLKPQLSPYRQFDGPFVPNLSIVDVLMFNSRDYVREFLTQYSLG
jgi:hypothetical protein